MSTRVKSAYNSPAASMDLAVTAMGQSTFRLCRNIHGKQFLIAADDVFSKWPEIVEMTSTTAANTIRVLQEIFARYGLPEQLVSSNGVQFVSYEYSEFCKSNGIKHYHVAPYHPASNGLAERMVQLFKQAMRKATIMVFLSNTDWPISC